MKTYQFTIPATPQQKRSASPFSNKHTGRAYMIPNKKNAPNERNIQQHFLDQTDWKIGDPIHDGPVAIRMTCYFPFLQSWPKFIKEIAEGQLMFKKPDVDRLLNQVFDSLQGLLFKDDCMVSKALPVKKYSEVPRTEIEITLMDNWIEKAREARKG